MNKLKLYLDLLRAGGEVADPEKWKKRQVTGTVLGSLLIVLLKIAEAHGYEVPVISEMQAEDVGAAIIILVNLLLTFTTTKKIGVFPLRPKDVSEPTASDNGATVQPQTDTNDTDEHRPG